MKIVSLAEVKSKLSAYVEVCQTEPVIITKNGRASAMLVPYSEDDDLVSLLVANNPRFRQKLEAAEKRLDETGGLSHDEFWTRVDALYEKPRATTKVAERKAPYRTRRTRKK
jgi:prevent-host-death family protein